MRDVKLSIIAIALLGIIALLLIGLLHVEAQENEIREEKRNSQQKKAAETFIIDDRPGIPMDTTIVSQNPPSHSNINQFNQWKQQYEGRKKFHWESQDEMDWWDKEKDSTKKRDRIHRELRYKNSNEKNKQYD